MQLIYMGFSQQGNIRRYRFEGVVPRQPQSKIGKNVEFLLCADMGLLAQHRIRVQDGLTLCLKLLTTAVATADNGALEFSNYVITHEDVSTFASARDALLESKMIRRKPRPQFKPSPSSQLKWRRT